MKQKKEFKYFFKKFHIFANHSAARPILAETPTCARVGEGKEKKKVIMEEKGTAKKVNFNLRAGALKPKYMYYL